MAPSTNFYWRYAGTLGGHTIFASSPRLFERGHTSAQEIDLAAQSLAQALDVLNPPLSKRPLSNRQWNRLSPYFFSLKTATASKTSVAQHNDRGTAHVELLTEQAPEGG